MLGIDLAGTYVAQLVVNDGLADSAPDAAVISTANTRPRADAGADDQIAAGETGLLDGSASSDADADPLSYQWALLFRPPGSAATLDTPELA